ncbi:MAG: bifunctional demethylmenaquinone methyltransferase/2-methoxy-6-polyprenyl-1,4-benzoquinol methylase UbiE [Sphingomonadales bacterium]
MTRKQKNEPPAETHFGFRQVAIGDKADLVRGVFGSVASRYDIMNDLMSGGIHRLWKSAMMDWLSPRPSMHLVDVAGGTGDIAFRFLDRASRTEKTGGTRASVTICDLSRKMLEVGRARARTKGYGDRIGWVCTDAEALPLPDRSADAYTIAFGIRNVTRIDAALRDAWRVLRPGGRFLCLEFSAVAIPGLDKLYDQYSFKVIPHMGQYVTGDRDSYQYLVESIRRFPNQEVFADMIRDAGFANVKYRNLSGGIAALHSGWKL